MEQHDHLRQTVATFLGMEPQQIHPALSFTGTRVHGSLARAKLYAALEQQAWEYNVKQYLPPGRMGNYMPLCLVHQWKQPETAPPRGPGTGGLRSQMLSEQIQALPGGLDLWH